MTRAITHSQAFCNWKGLQARDAFASDYAAMKCFYEKQEALLHQLNQQAALVGARAGWAFRQMRRMDEQRDTETER